MVFLIQKNMDVERCRTCNYLGYEKIDRQYEKGARSHQQHGNEEEWRIVSFITKVGLRDEMISAIVGMVKGDMVAKELSADWMMAERIMH